MSSGGFVHRAGHGGLVGQPLDPAAGRPAGCTGPGPGGCRSTAGRQAAAGDGPSRARPASGSPRAARAWPPSPARADSIIGSSASRLSTDSQRSRTSTVMLVRVGAEPVLHVLAGLLQVLHLQLDRGHPAAVAQRDQVLAASGRGRSPAASATGPSTARSPSRNPSSIIASTSAVRAHLEVGGDLAHVRVADDHVQPPVLLRVGVRLVAGVDDRPLERGLQPDLDLEEVGALADLEARRPGRPRRGRPGRRRRRPAGTRRTGSGGGRCRRTASPGASGSSRGSRRTRPCCRCCSCTAGSAEPPGIVTARRRGLGHHPLPGLVPDARRRAGWCTRARSTPGARGRRTAGPRW